MTQAEQAKRDEEASAIMADLIRRRGLEPEAAYEEAKDIIERRYFVSRAQWPA